MNYVEDNIIAHIEKYCSFPALRTKKELLKILQESRSNGYTKEYLDWKKLKSSTNVGPYTITIDIKQSLKNTFNKIGGFFFSLGEENMDCFYPIINIENRFKGLRKEQTFVDALDLLKNKLGSNISSIYYPCCADDISPSCVFFRQQISYLDQNLTYKNQFTQAGLNYIVSDVEKHIINGYDLVILLNPQISYFSIDHNLTSGSYIFCNNYHQTATELRKSDKYDLISVIYRDGNRLRRDELSLDDYFTQQSFSDDELEKYLKEIGSYEAIISSDLGDDISIHKRYENFIESFDETEMMIFKEMGRYFWKAGTDEEKILDLRMPVKKSGQEFYVFRKK